MRAGAASAPILQRPGDGGLPGQQETHGAANVPAGSAYEDALIQITKDPHAAKDLNGEDLYTLVPVGLSEEWTTAVIVKAFGKSKELAEAAGWARSTRDIKQWAAGLGFAFEAMQEGMEYLRTLGVLKSVAGDPLAWGWASKEMLDAFRVTKFMEYPKWVRELALSDTEAGGHLKRYLVEQGSVCRASGKRKKGQKSMDVEEAGRRSVCQWLLWTFPPSEGWSDLKGLYGNVPAVKGLRSEILQSITEGPVYGQQYDQERATTTAYNLDDERKLGLPLERDCAGLLPSAFTAKLKPFMKDHPYITRKQRADVLKVTIVEPAKESGDGAGKGALVLDETLVSNIMASNDSFSPPSVAAIEEGLENLWVMDSGQWKESKSGVELVWLTLPLPERIGDEDEAIFDIRNDPLWDEDSPLKEAVQLGLQLLTAAGVLVVVSPVGVFADDLVPFEDLWPPHQPHIRATTTVTVGVEGKKAKVSLCNITSHT